MSITFDTAHSAAHRRGNRRKAVQTIGFLARRSEVTPPETIFTPEGELTDLAGEGGAGFDYAGMITTDGPNFSREDSVEGDGSHGFVDNTREDLTTSERTVVVTFQEAKKRVIQEIADGADYRGLQVATSELVKHKPSMPVNEEWVLVYVFRDGPAGDEHLTAKVLPTIKAQSVGGEQWGKESITREVTFKVYVDDELGVPEIEIESGAAFLADAEQLGWGVSSGGGGEGND